jgi:hypothetical protein
MEVITNINSLDAAIHNTLQYYAFFRYPLSAAEIHARCTQTCRLEDVTEYLYEQCAQGKLFASEDLYTLLNDADALVLRRKQGKIRAEKELKLAKRVGQFLYLFPFVKFIGISGSLSKGFADNKSDFDFFIITAENRLWICRTILHVFKKLTFLAGQQHKFCMNYFIDEAAVQLDEKNIYTATELSTLIPISGSDTYRKLMNANQWMCHVLPNKSHQYPCSAEMKNKQSAFGKLLEWLLDKSAPNALNRFLMRMTDIKWRKKWARKNYPMQDYDLAFRTTLHVSKNHAANYQKKILEQLNKKIN